MKSFKQIRETVNEEYYSGPTSYAGSDSTNVGDIAGTNLGTFANGSRKVYADRDNMSEILGGLNAEMAGTKLDPVAALTRGRSALNMTGLNFEIDPAAIRNAATNGEVYETPLMFMDRVIGEEPPSYDIVATGEIGNEDDVQHEKELPSGKLSFMFMPSGSGYRITATIMK